MKPEDIKPDTFPKYTGNPLTKDLPDHLKDHANYDKIQRALLDAGATKHSHADMEAWSGCSECQQAQWNRKEMMKELGFTSGKQYMAWQRIHEEIKSRVPL